MKPRMPVSRRVAKAQPSQEEWLGAESHNPILSGALRRRSSRGWQPLFWMVGALFVTGLLVGSTATWVLCRSRRPA